MTMTRPKGKPRKTLLPIERDMLAFILAHGEATPLQLLEFVQDGDTVPTRPMFFEILLAFRNTLTLNEVKYSSGRGNSIRIGDTRSILKATMLCYPRRGGVRKVALPPVEVHA